MANDKIQPSCDVQVVVQLRTNIKYNNKLLFGQYIKATDHLVWRLGLVVKAVVSGPLLFTAGKTAVGSLAEDPNLHSQQHKHVAHMVWLYKMSSKAKQLRGKKKQD